MSKLLLQFHADRQELWTWIAEWSLAHGLSVATESLSSGTGYHVNESPPLEVGGGLRLADEVFRVVVSVLPIDFANRSANDFVSSNSNALFVTLGSQVDDWLRESALSASTDDRDSIRIWRQVRKAAVGQMKVGGTVFSPVTGASAPARGHYFSPEAVRLARQGIRLLAFAGWNEYKPEDIR